MFDNVNWTVVIGLLALWSLFLLFAPQMLIYWVSLFIAAWQVGVWISKIGIKQE